MHNSMFPIAFPCRPRVVRAEAWLPVSGSGASLTFWLRLFTAYSPCIRCAYYL